MSGKQALWLGCCLVMTFAGRASAVSLVGSVHDLDIGPRDPSTGGSVADRACVYCHTPHTSGQGKIALWNPKGTAKSYPVYGAEGSQGTASRGPIRSSSICLTCHDGSVASDTVATFTQERSRPATTGPGGGQLTLFSADPASLSVTADHGPNHPVGILYYSAPDLVPAPPKGKFLNGVQLIDGKVECASCHAPPQRCVFSVPGNLQHRQRPLLHLPHQVIKQWRQWVEPNEVRLTWL